MRHSGFGRLFGSLLVAVALASVAQGSFVATGVMGEVRVAGDPQPLQSGSPIDGVELEIGSRGCLMAFYNSGETEATLIAAGPAKLKLEGSAIIVSSGQVRLIVSGKAAEPFELVLQSDDGELVWFVTQGEVRAVREGESAVGVSYQGPGTLESDSGIQVPSGAAVWTTNMSEDPAPATMADFSTHATGLDQLADLRVAHARSTRQQREVSLFDNVLVWDNVSKGQVVQQEIRRQDASRARAEIRQVAAVTTSATPPRAVVPPVVAQGAGRFAGGANALSVVGQGQVITRGAGVLSLAGDN